MPCGLRQVLKYKEAAEKVAAEANFTLSNVVGGTAIMVAKSVGHRQGT